MSFNCTFGSIPTRRTLFHWNRSKTICSPAISPALSYSRVDDFLSLSPRILHRLIGPALISFNAADYQIGTVYHFAVPCLDGRLKMSACGGLAYFDFIIVALKRIAFVVIRNEIHLSRLADSFEVHTKARLSPYMDSDGLYFIDRYQWILYR